MTNKIKKTIPLLNEGDPLDPVLLGLYIKDRRVNAKMTQEVTALLCGVSKKTLIKIEKGGDVYFSTLMKVMNSLGIKLSIIGNNKQSSSSRFLDGDENDGF